MADGAHRASGRRYRRHQLVFETTGAAVLAATSGRWDLVAVSGAVLLPGIRSTWVGWLRQIVRFVVPQRGPRTRT